MSSKNKTARRFEASGATTDGPRFRFVLLWAVCSIDHTVDALAFWIGFDIAPWSVVVGCHARVRNCAFGDASKKG